MGGTQPFSATTNAAGYLAWADTARAFFIEKAQALTKISRCFKCINDLIQYVWILCKFLRDFYLILFQRNS